MTSNIIPMPQKPTLQWVVNEAIDQSAHALAAIAVITLVSWVGASFTPLAGMLLGYALGAVREITEGGDKLSDGSICDQGFWALGGLAGALING